MREGITKFCRMNGLDDWIDRLTTRTSVNFDPCNHGCTVQEGGFWLVNSIGGVNLNLFDQYLSRNSCGFLFLFLSFCLSAITD